MSTVHIVCEENLDTPVDLDTLQTCLESVLSDHGETGTVSILLTNNTTLHRLNKEYRNIDAPTDVLSFDLRDPVHPEAEELGELYISVEKARIQADEANRPFAQELTHLAVHGVLHLLGFDHDTDASYAHMRDEENRYLSL
ncbi:MAG: rRNA maturation RNase YbeY [bacterium]|nr:rRNA maturation RNase YbeY [bacterium]